MVIFDVAMNVRDYKSPEWTPKKQRNSDIRNLLTMAGIMATDAVRQQNIFSGIEESEDLRFLDREIFRSGEIPPGEYVRGKMFFPVHPAPYQRLILLLDNTEFVLDFRKADERDLRALGL